MNELDSEKIFEGCPLHIVLMVKAAKKALDEGHARIQDGLLVVDPPKPTESLDKQKAKRQRLTTPVKEM